MKFGIGYANTGMFTQPGAAAELACRAEAAGFESIWTVEHVIWPSAYESAYPYHPSGKMPGGPSTPLPDPLVWLTWVGSRTTTIRLATGIVILPQRNPLILAKEVATLDHLSAGRVVLGVGVGWLEEEFDALGVPFERRGRRADEYLEAMGAVWAGDHASYEGEFVRFRDVSVNPKPAQGSVPVVIGGNTAAAARRAVRHRAGFYPGPASLEALEAAIGRLREEADRAGVDPGVLEVTAAHPAGLLDDPRGRARELVQRGVARVLVSAFRIQRAGLDVVEELGRELADVS